MVARSLSREEIRDVDRRAVEEYGLPSIVLMENAGRGCADLLTGPAGVARGASVAICCGQGNNGGDGFVVARHLENRGVRVQVFVACEPSALRGDAATNFEVVRRSGLPLTIAPSAEDWQAIAPRLCEADWLVDALLGTGFSGEPREPFASAITSMNASGRPILAVDLPSGMDAETGRCAAICIRARRTATFVARKHGFLRVTNPQETVGIVDIIEIGVPRDLLTSFGLGQELD